ncbi:hypothetical protein Kpol_473p19 [Vanderwaltozyma polyspora DSM 70294]|uniref:BZIP domain-containing protein n=1 Tax=Vanderwaltozyma polyspora (strain ATCC 22028 / DSM 70294 / BCRC 21397 / CBS 2163 / NBRC 10782 / NRRL Y-8283 / UCD 57-17) TaxID=436907 RepID=A7TQ11_VANPO|nr:uncharacterized protein Kpol_473p19 [Vanderwaltozyma polyspora DSM 70294]EDO15660.1 hypothetical protein Kpol_473p19 [Vanderwaltozyma polyspora DSM 70294]
MIPVIRMSEDDIMMRNYYMPNNITNACVSANSRLGRNEATAHENLNMKMYGNIQYVGQMTSSQQHQQQQQQPRVVDPMTVGVPILPKIQHLTQSNGTSNSNNTNTTANNPNNNSNGSANGLKFATEVYLPELRNVAITTTSNDNIKGSSISSSANSGTTANTPVSTTPVGSTSVSTSGAGTGVMATSSVVTSTPSPISVIDRPTVNRGIQKSKNASKRAIQNRNAQKAFRERKKLYIQELERKAYGYDRLVMENTTLKNELHQTKRILQIVQNNNVQTTTFGR